MNELLPSCSFSYLVFSDVHLGHPKNRTEFILRNLTAFFDNFESSSSYTKLDIIFIAGDLFHDLLDLSTEEVHEIQMWLWKLVGFCSKHKIKLRVLKGTPSHDWDQYDVLDTVVHVSGYEIDYKYYENIDIERLSEGVDVVYIPDMPSRTADDMLEEVREKMLERGIDKVDIGIMHGMFDYQLGNIPKDKHTHDTATYQKMVRGLIHIGHIHSYSACGKIIAQGSFDRIAHGEEEDKGAVLVKVVNGEYKPSFIRNKGARIFKTVKLKSEDMEVSRKQLEKDLQRVPKDSYVRIKASKNHPIFANFQLIKQEFPFFHLTKQPENEEDEVIPVYEATKITYTPIVITPDNIVELLLGEIKKKHALSNSKLEVLHRLLGEVT